MTSLSRREFIRRSGALSLLGTAAPLALNLAGIGRAAAATASDYKALICVYLTGGNDAYNTVLATDEASWSAYTFERGQEPDSPVLRAPGTPASGSASAPFADQLGGVLPIVPRQAQDRTFALHPCLTGVRDLFAGGQLAIVSNVGPLIQPTAKADYLAGVVAKPTRLFSHNDQQSTWQSLSAEGARVGWGGRVAEHFLAANGGSMFTSLSLAGSAVWVNGQQLKPYQLAQSGVIAIGAGIGGQLFSSALAQQKLVDIVRNARTTHLVARDHASVAARSNDAEALLRGALPAAAAAPWGTPGVVAPQIDPLLLYSDPDTGTVSVNALAAQLQTVVRMIAARTTLGVSRQVFFVSLDGFDTHDGQARKHASLLARLSHGLSYLDGTLRAMGLVDSVTAFTASDFGRSFTSNGDGTDHGWGGHHFVLGGAVRGGDLYGRFPVYGASDGAGGYASDDQVANGALLPQASVEQYGATLAQWFGLSAAEQVGVFPNLANFGAEDRNLGFMG